MDSRPLNSIPTPTNSIEKTHHLTYLEGFRVESCPLFKQHQCQQHRPYTCFNWHFANQRRRKPVRRQDGSFNYSPDIYCEKYDENTGICPDGDGCIYLHRVSGDVERKYHLRYYKTAQCVHPTDARGQCVKNGAHCAFAHSSTDLRQPQHDTSEGAYVTCLGDVEGRDRTSFVIEDPLWHSVTGQDHVLSCYKTEQCRKPARLCRQGYACPFYHNSKDRRRPPATFKYRSTPCPAAKTVDEWLDPELCEQGDNCGYCHTRTEQQFHPEIYKSTKCNDMLEHGYCPRAVFCAFAHHNSEMHVQRTPYAYSSQHSPNDHGSPVSDTFRLGSPATTNGTMNGFNPQSPNSFGKNINKSFGTSRDDLISSSYPKAPGFERGPTSPNCNQQDQRNRTYSLNIGHLDMAKRTAVRTGQWECNLLANAALARSDSGFHNVSNTLEELSLDLAPIEEHRDGKPFNELFTNSMTSPMRIPGSESYHTSPLASYGEPIFQSNPKLNIISPAAPNSVFSAFPAVNTLQEMVMMEDPNSHKDAQVWEEGLKQARQACEAWRADAELYKQRAEQAENERNRALFERDQALKQLAALRIQTQGGQSSDFNQQVPSGSHPNYSIFGYGIAGRR